MITKSERTKSLEETQVDPNEDLMTRGVRSGIKGAALAASRLGDVAATGADMAANYLKKKEPPKRTLEDFLGESPKKAREREQEIRRETRGVKDAPGPRDFLNSLNKKADEAEQRALDQEIRRETRGVKKPLFEKFKLSSGGKVSSASKRADGIATKGKTRGKMV